MGTIKDLTGKKYGMLTVENRGADRYGKTGRKFITWDCICECGNHIGYDDSLTIERIDNNGNYEPDNCKWIPIEMQASDRRSSRILTYNGKSQTMAQ